MLKRSLNDSDYKVCVPRLYFVSSILHHIYKTLAAKYPISPGNDAPVSHVIGVFEYNIRMFSYEISH